ncbi:MAG: GTPase HflX [Victivallales bacterium]|nr:GTPase HflX [Victivallales bacterium]
MFFIDDRKDTKKVINAFLVGIRSSEISGDKAYEYVCELAELADTMGLEVLGHEIVNLRAPNSRFYIGSGKVNEIAEKAKSLKAECIIVDFEITPAQQRNWEKVSGLCVIDRQEVILDIFAERAITKEASLQVELARMEYSLPRLKRAWTHLSRQRGGAKGTRGEGEKQIEADRRMVQQRISFLKKELEEVKKHREVQRSKRENAAVPSGAIIGYTNVGKSSLLNCLAGSDVMVENKLFATLDSTTRVVDLPEKQKVLLSDTVGFIRKLPHKLVEAFKSTLEAALISDFIIHVLDASSLSVEEHFRTTVKLLEELNSSGKPILTVYNKVDLIEKPAVKARLRAIRPDAVFTSVKEGIGIEEIEKRILKQITSCTERVNLRIPVSNSRIPFLVYKYGRVLSIKYEHNYTYITAKIARENLKPFSDFIVREAY